MIMCSSLLVGRLLNSIVCPDLKHWINSTSALHLGKCVTFLLVKRELEENLLRASKRPTLKPAIPFSRLGKVNFYLLGFLLSFVVVFIDVASWVVAVDQVVMSVLIRNGISVDTHGPMSKHWKNIVKFDRQQEHKWPPRGCWGWFVCKRKMWAIS